MKEEEERARKKMKEVAKIMERVVLGSLRVAAEKKGGDGCGEGECGFCISYGASVGEEDDTMVISCSTFFL